MPKQPDYVRDALAAARDTLQDLQDSLTGEIKLDEQEMLRRTRAAAAVAHRAICGGARSTREGLRQMRRA
jgi:hypothetical protein